MGLLRKKKTQKRVIGKGGKDCGNVGLACASLIIT